MGVLHFHKYQGTGNDFVMIDDRERRFDKGNLSLIAKLCHRRFGIGADGVILIRDHHSFDFEMIYFNPDGSQSLCGNGSRCAVHFAGKLGMIDKEAHFLAVDGPHRGFIKNGAIHIRMPDVDEILDRAGDFFVDTGSPHHIKIVAEVAAVDVFQEGKAIRHSAPYGQEGTNVNFVEMLDQKLKVRTFERGVEDETMSCGTGVTAVALVLSTQGYRSPVPLQTKGGDLQVAFDEKPEGGFTNVYLIGPAEEVFEGDYRF